MSLVLELPAEYGFVLLAASASFFLNTIHGIFTVQARKKSGLSYPVSYADKALADKDPNAYAFNCTQRAHANFTENHTSFLGALLVSGLKYPVASAVLGGTWVASRFIYGLGYASSGPKGRSFGFLGHILSDTPLKLMAVYTAYTIAFGN